jgi:hypothetical protein
MGENADQTRDEIVQLRQDMSRKIASLRKAAERPVRIAKMVAVGTVVVVVVGGSALLVAGARRRAQAVAEPEKTVKMARRVAEKTAGETRERLREEVRKQLEKELKESRPLHEKILTTAARSAATAAVPIVLRKLQERVDSSPAGSRRA